MSSIRTLSVLVCYFLIFCVLLYLFHSQGQKLCNQNIYKYLRRLTGKKAPSNKTPALTKSTKKGIWAVGTTNQLFIRGS